jgi:hypothetical protein
MRTLFRANTSAPVLPHDQSLTEIDGQPKHLARRGQPPHAHPSHEREEPETAISGDAGDEEDEEDEDEEVGPPKAALEGGKDEGAEDAGGGGDGADEHERGGGHVERRLSKEDRRRGDGREPYAEVGQGGVERDEVRTHRLTRGTMRRGI